MTRPAATLPRWRFYSPKFWEAQAPQRYGNRGACILYLESEASVCVRLSVPRSQRALTLYPATDYAAATDISGVNGRWQLSR